MESRATNIEERAGSVILQDEADQQIHERLNALIKLNADIDRDKRLFGSDRERTEALLMERPIPISTAFALFGLMIGALTPAAIFIRFILDLNIRFEQAWLLVLMALTNVAAAGTGFATGKTIGRWVGTCYQMPLGSSLLMLPCIGILWGVIAGAAGGVFFFIIGAFFGAILGGAVGAVALPAFALLHSAVKQGEMIDQRHFLPLAFGVTLTICGYILGL